MNSSSLRVLGSRIKEARESLGFTQQEFADHLGKKSYQIVSRWESNLSYPPLPTLDEIAVLTRRPIGWFFNDAVGASFEKAGPPIHEISAALRKLEAAEVLAAQARDELAAVVAQHSDRTDSLCRKESTSK
ncbi:MAG: helix-turn-helix domain-containing protein [Vulcanimicrobiota bacterium]